MCVFHNVMQQIFTTVIFFSALLYVQNLTVVAVQWEHLARGPWYDEAAANIETVAHDLFQFLLSVEERGIDLNRVHIIGFSLGAHVAGFTGAMLEGRVGRISGNVFDN